MIALIGIILNLKVQHNIIHGIKFLKFRKFKKYIIKFCSIYNLLKEKVNSSKITIPNY